MVMTDVNDGLGLQKVTEKEYSYLENRGRPTEKHTGVELGKL